MEDDGIESECLHRQGRDDRAGGARRNHGAIAVMSQRPRCHRRARHRPRDGKALPFQVGADTIQHRLFAVEQMRGAGDVEQQPVRRIERDEGREAVAPIGNAFEEFCVRRFVGRHHLQRRQHGARIGERHADMQAE